jgi:DNA mismatch repair protein MutL
MAIAYPYVRIRLINNGNVLFATQGKGDVCGCIFTVYNTETGKSLLHVSKESEMFALEGFVSSPEFSRSSRKTQVFFVHGRSITSKVMERGVASAFADKLTGGRYPVCFLFLKIPPERLDVNIHPNKKEIKFEDENGASEFIEQAIKEALATKDAAPAIRKEKIFNLKPEKQEKREQVDIKNILYTMREEEKTAAKTESSFVKEETEIFDREKFNLSLLNVIGAIFSTYITALDEDSLYLIDQHAAHERIFYEKLMYQYANEGKNQQLLMAPLVIDVAITTKNEAEEWLDILRKSGFEIEGFGPKTYIIKAVPAFMNLAESEEFIGLFMDNVSDSADFKNPKEIERIMSNACKSAVKANDTLTKEEMRSLIANLSKCENPFHCPHGRPTFIRLTRDEIEKMFFTPEEIAESDRRVAKICKAIDARNARQDAKLAKREAAKLKKLAKLGKLGRTEQPAVA